MIRPKSNPIPPLVQELLTTWTPAERAGFYRWTNQYKIELDDPMIYYTTGIYKIHNSNVEMSKISYDLRTTMLSFNEKLNKYNQSNIDLKNLVKRQMERNSKTVKLAIKVGALLLFAMLIGTFVSINYGYKIAQRNAISDCYNRLPTCTLERN